MGGHSVRVGAVGYLNARPLIHGFEQGLGAGRIELSTEVPSVLADRMAGGSFDVALLPVVELERMTELELVPGLSVSTFGPSLSVLLVARRSVEQVESVALDPDSRTSNALARVLLADVWGRRPTFVQGSSGLAETLRVADAAVRIGDKALFEPLPDGCRAYDLGTVWTEATGLPFVFAAWAAWPGAVDREVYRLLHESRRLGSRAVERIASDYRWNGSPHAELALAYLTRHIRHRLGDAEIRAMELFFARARAAGAIERQPEIRLLARRVTECDRIAAHESGAPVAGREP